MRDVFDQDRLALQRGLADDAAAELDAHALDLGGVAGLEAHPELVGAVVDEQDGEDAVVDDGADEVGDAMHQGVEVERGVERVGEAEEEVELQRLEADVGRGRVGMEERSRLTGGGPVVAFEWFRRGHARGTAGFGCGRHLLTRFYSGRVCGTFRRHTPGLQENPVPQKQCTLPAPQVRT